jgi:hypothetical protein
MNLALAIPPILETTSCLARRPIEMDKVRASALHRYVPERRYTAENHKHRR